MAVLPWINLLALSQALQQDCKDAETDMVRLRLDTDCFPPESHLEFGIRSELTLLDRACNEKVPTVSHAALQYCIRTPSASKSERHCLQGETAQPMLGNIGARLHSLSHCLGGADQIRHSATSGRPRIRRWSAAS